jgi:uncharacterized protein
MKCSFCFWNDIQKEADGNMISASDIHKFINRQSHIHHGITNIVFYGGEPLLNQELVEDIINHSSKEELRYSLYTNGLLLGNIKQSILSNLSYLIVSIDGDKDKNDKYRGEGNYDIVLKNVSEINGTFGGETIARLTLTNESSLYESIRPIIDNFDHFFWQFESNKVIMNSSISEESYTRDIDLLLDFWLDRMNQGILYNLIPFQAITASLLLNKKVSSPRCGCGTSYIYIHSDGNCYACDELVGYSEFHIGNIFDGINFSGEFKYKDLTFHCIDCEVRDICGGRCIAAYVKYPQEKWKYYCNNTKTLIYKMQSLSDRIKKAIFDGGFTYNDLDTFPCSHIFEEIP